MRIFIDADACPKIAKEILYRACERTKIRLIMVANKYMQVPVSPFIQLITVSAGFDEADKKIAELVQENDLVITADIPLADIVVDKNAIALNPRGTLYTKDTIKRCLATRDLMQHLRDNQMIAGGPSEYTKSDGEALANQLDRILTKYTKNKKEY